MEEEEGEGEDMFFETKKIFLFIALYTF